MVKSGACQDMKEEMCKSSIEISHLSSDEVEQLYHRYIQGEKNAVLVGEFNIDITPNKLIDVFPPQVLNDTLCPYCGTPMFHKRKSKSHSRWDDIIVRCFQCEHKVFFSDHSPSTQQCNCGKCVTLRWQEKLNEEKIRRDMIRKEFSFSDRKPIAYSELEFFQKLILLTLMRMHTDEDFEYILSLDSLSKTEFLSPTDKMDIECLNSLFSAMVIVVDPESPLYAFSEEIEDNSFDLRKTRWLPNVTIDTFERASLQELYNEIYNELENGVQAQWESDVFSTIYKIATEEVLQYIHVRADELNVYFTAENKTREIVKELLHRFSVSEIYYFVKKSVEDAHIFYSKGYAKSKKHAANIIPNKMLSLGERATGEGWEPYRYTRDSRAPRSYVSQIFYDFVLKDQSSGFTKSPGKYWAKELYPKYFSERNILINDDVQCPECGSFDVTIKMLDSALEVNCQGCGVISSFTPENNK